MRNQYTCIGGFVDLNGLSLIRFDLDGDRFKILATREIQRSPDPSEVVGLAMQLAKVHDHLEVEQLDLLTNFDGDLKALIPDRTESGQIITRQTTPIEPKQSNIFALKRLIHEDRIRLATGERIAAACLDQVKQITQESIDDTYEGNPVLTHTLRSLFHSVAVLERRRASLNPSGRVSPAGDWERVVRE